MDFDFDVGRVLGPFAVEHGEAETPQANRERSQGHGTRPKTPLKSHSKPAFIEKPLYMCKYINRDMRSNAQHPWQVARLDDSARGPDSSDPPAPPKLVYTRKRLVFL